MLTIVVGKTILASLVIGEARNLAPAPTVLFFYCKYGDSTRNNFLSIARSLLAQLLKQDKDLLPYMYEKYSSCGEPLLSARDFTEELLRFSLSNCVSAYIILDGLDECPRDEIKTTVAWFRELIESLPTADPDRLRCLFVSQNGSARKDFNGLSSVTIEACDTESDIEVFSKIQSCQLQFKLNISDEEASQIADSVSTAAEGRQP